jgi:hypothetical protein
VTEYAATKIAKAIHQLPIGLFISAGAAADVLGVTKQAFSKNSRIKRGFIYSCKAGDKKLFFRPSVEAFSKSNDGRIRIDNYIHEAQRQLNELKHNTKTLTHQVQELKMSTAQPRASVNTSTAPITQFIANDEIYGGAINVR